MRKLPLLVLALLAALQSSSAQSSCIKTPYNKKIRVVGRNNNIVENMDFESGNYAWMRFPDTDSNRTKIVTDPVNPASHCARMVSLDNADGDALLSQVIPNLMAGKTYTAAAWLRSAGTGSNTGLHATLQVRFNYPQQTSSTLLMDFYPTSTWQQYAFNFTVPNISGVEVSLVQVMLYRGQQDTVYVDSVEIQNPNLVTNADFETGSSDWLQLPDASRVSLAGYGARSTNTCMKLTSLNTVDGDALLVQTIPNLSAGQTYTFKAYLRSAHALPDNAVEANLHVRLNYTNGWQSIQYFLVKPDSVCRLYRWLWPLPAKSLCTSAPANPGSRCMCCRIIRKATM